MDPKQLEKLARLLLSLKIRIKCSICLDYIENTVELECSHRFCNNCLTEVRLQSPKCPLCNQQIPRRASLYKDHFADELSKFTNRACQLVKEKYAHDVDELCSEKTNLQEVIDRAPQDIQITTVDISKNLENETVEHTDSFDRLQTNSRRCYANKRKQVNQLGKAKVLNFKDNETRAKIINWLNDNQQKLDILTQSPQFLDDAESEFQMPSISQVHPIQNQKHTNRTRSQSLNLAENLPEPLLKRYQSLTEGLNENENYNIEEVHSETIVKQLERKVILDMLENECLQTLDHVAELDNEKTKAVPCRKKRSHSKTENTNVNISCPDSGWDRIDNVKKTLEMTTKKPKKLNIKLQSPNAGVKTSPTDNAKKTTTIGNKRKISPKASKAGKNKHRKTREPCVAKKESDNKADHTLNLNVIEICNQTDTIKMTLMKNDNKMNVMDVTAINRNDELPNNKENVSNNVKKLDDDIFYLPTQITSHSTDQQSTICHISPVTKEVNNLDNIAIRLSDHLKSCISSASNLRSDFGNLLVECFTNLLTYSNKIVQISLEKVSTETQTSETSKACKKSASVQTGNISVNTVSVQSIIPTANKCVQTFRSLHNVTTQTNNLLCLEQGIQVTPKDKLENMNKKISNEEITTSVTSKSSKTVHISDDISKSSKSSKKLDKVSQDSILLCTLDPSNKSDKKVNRKLTYQESQARKFKRIRKPASDSESEEDRNPSKKKFIKDDLTVEFLDTQKPLKNSDREVDTPESEQMDYDKYLFEVMRKYDPSPPKKKNLKTAENTLLNNQLNSNQNPPTKSKSQESRKYTLESKVAQSQEKLQKDSDSEYVFTANLAFQENLAKFDQEILEYERAAKTYDTESDLVENTPIVIPTRTLPRSNSKVPGSIKIISKGSASSKNISSLPLKAMEENYSNFEDREPRVEENTEDVNDILKDIHKKDLFKSGLDLKKDNVLDNAKTNINSDQEQQINVTQENIDKVLENFPHFDDDEGIEEELQKISFTAAQAESSKKEKIVILQNVTISEQNEVYRGNDLDKVIESSDVSDEEIVETTPKKQLNLRDRSFLNNFGELENSNKADDVCLPPPPGFGDDDRSSPLEILKEPLSPNESGLVNKDIIPSVTPDRLSDFILSPEKKAMDNEKKDSQQSIFFKPSIITPAKPAKDKGDSLRISQIIVDNSENVFSPITKSSVKLTQAKYNPLVLTSRSTKKTILMTSTPNQKSILNYVVPSQESPAVISQKSKPCIMWSRILNKDLNVFTQLECRKLLTTSKVFSPQVTHLVVLVDEKGQIVSHTAKTVQAIAAGIWVVRYEWAEDCLMMNRIVPEESYEALDATGMPGPQIARLTRKAKPLFKDFLFYCAPPFKIVPKGDLESILKLSGGEIARDLGAFLQDDAKVHIILTESSATEEADHFETWLKIYKAVTVDVEWLTSCIGQYKLVSFRPFLISGDESKICDLAYPEILVESVPFTLTEAT